MPRCFNKVQRGLPSPTFLCHLATALIHLLETQVIRSIVALGDATPSHLP